MRTEHIRSVPFCARRDMLNRGFDMVVGARFGKSVPRCVFKDACTHYFLLLVEFTTGKRIPDINSDFSIPQARYFAVLSPIFVIHSAFTTTQTLIYQLTGRFVGYVPVAYESAWAGQRCGSFATHFVRCGISSKLLFGTIRSNYSFCCLSSHSASALWCRLLSVFGYFCGFLCSMLIFSLGIIAEALRSLRRVSKSVP